MVRNPDVPLGRPPRNTDAEILQAIREGYDTVPTLLPVLGQRHKTSMLTRLRRMERAGLLTIEYRRGRTGFLLRVVGDEDGDR